VVYSRSPMAAAAATRPAEPERALSQKALTLLGATEEEVRMQRALIMHAPGSPCDSGQRIYVEHFLEPDEYEAVTPDSRPKAERILGVSGEQPLTWLKRETSDRGRMVRSKALAKLGATLDDVRIEKALLVLGEAPGREIPAGRLPRPSLEPPRKVWAIPPPKSEDAPAPSVSVFLVAFFPWGVLAPLNVLKLQLNKVSPGAHLWVPAATEQCQAACGVARMWATLFWSLQFASAIAAIYLHYNRERGLALLGVSQKLVVGSILLKAYAQGVIYWPIGLAGGLVEWTFALLYVRELRKP